MSAPASSGGSVISLAGRAGYRPDLGSRASAQVSAARGELHLSHEDFAAYLSERVSWAVAPGAVALWEQGSVPPGDILLACDGQVPGRELLEAVPASFTADTLSGAWVTCYRFSQPPKCHADIARLEVTSGRHVRITNYPPEPRTEGHAAPFHNEIEALLAGRHLVGCWKNTNDARYFGALHLSVLPGETVMEGYYTNFVDDVHVGAAFWKWVRVEPGSLAGTDLSAMTLHDPARLHALLEAHSQYDAPLALTALGEVA
jgi:hypothetical protein